MPGDASQRRALRPVPPFPRSMPVCCSGGTPRRAGRLQSSAGHASFAASIRAIRSERQRRFRRRRPGRAAGLRAEPGGRLDRPRPGGRDRAVRHAHGGEPWRAPERNPRSPDGCAGARLGARSGAEASRAQAVAPVSKDIHHRKRIERGAGFWREHAASLARAGERFGVPPEIIVAIIGVETFYGVHRGRIRVLDALATLGFPLPEALGVLPLRARGVRAALE